MKKLLIDIPALIESGKSVEDIKCEYFYHRDNPGQFSLLEVAEFAVYCRQCKDAFCVLACPKEALEKMENGLVKRYNMRCVGCKSCILACPFGTIFPEVINYITAKCDYCLEQLKSNPDYVPLCVKTSPNGAFKMVDIEKEDPENNLFFYGEHLAIKSHSWRHKEDKA
ncbi:MAG: 4Fe-4S ferredoxin [Candidatus Neomarinimicrobiota bacterium]|nr:4Fe-4S binding protein [Candidatus Neomarinimicrobiota bacterium]MCD6100273.1 4Fe-4S binding protein [Candidatus Neomarinimicrobiota bacterium]RKY48073.1 MAG: 4Fe-4S ferredoxin [Candidatus Neomarinimicrobiota bacterium]RKY53520.1 MAG: 4Fe-4S ferredoxin [Candidatus Neomarinimicrobiota bacterium]HDN58883.1 4Fe-4S ferredoxin [Candidatus Neomarinimicrobiota bacterium]